jgi:putative nucleotidyltransferase with HDIG domain
MADVSNPPPADLAAAVDEFAHHLVAALLCLRMHAATTLAGRDALETARSMLRRAARAGVPMPLRLELGPDNVRWGGCVLPGTSLQSGPLLDVCGRKGIAAIELDPGVTAPELGRLLGLLDDQGAADAFRNGASLEGVLAGHGVQHAEFRLAGGTWTDSRARQSVGDYRRLTSFLQDTHVDASRGRTLGLDRASGVVERAIAQMDEEPSALLALATYDDIDAFTVGHSVRVALLALQVARAAGARDELLITIGTAALLHDIGKSRVPHHILWKRGRLDPTEWEVMAQHPRLGAEILLEQRDLDPRAIGAAFCHHLGSNGRGYPTPYLAFPPSSVSKLVRVCDVFEALTAVRPYKRALAPLQAYAVMYRNRDDFDHAWLDFFVRTLGIYPLGTRLLLRSGEEAIVTAAGSDPRHPEVTVVAHGEPTALAASCDSRRVVGELREGVPTEIAGVFGVGANRDQIDATLQIMHCGMSEPGCSPA